MAEDKLKNLKEVIALVLDGVGVAVQAKADGHVGLEDLPLLMTLLPDLIPAIDGVGVIPAEIAAMVPADAEDLIAFTAAHMTVASPRARELVDASLKAAFSIYNLIKVIKQ